MRRPAVVVLAALSLVVAGCEIQPDAAPRDIPPGERLPLDPSSGPDAGQASGAGRIFLAVTDPDGGEVRLRSVLREASETASLFEALIGGPNGDEVDVGLETMLPPDLVLNTPPRITANTLTLDVSEEILSLSSDQARLAVAQIVFTANEIEGVRSVRLRVDGTAREWPNGRGELLTEALTIYDYPGVAESSQPPYPPLPSRSET